MERTPVKRDDTQIEIWRGIEDRIQQKHTNNWVWKCLKITLTRTLKHIIKPHFKHFQSLFALELSSGLASPSPLALWTSWTHLNGDKIQHTLPCWNILVPWICPSSPCTCPWLVAKTGGFSTKPWRQCLVVNCHVFSLSCTSHSRPGSKDVLGQVYCMVFGARLRSGLPSRRLYLLWSTL